MENIKLEIFPTITKNKTYFRCLKCNCELNVVNRVKVVQNRYKGQISELKCYICLSEYITHLL